MTIVNAATKPTAMGSTPHLREYPRTSSSDTAVARLLARHDRQPAGQRDGS